MYPNLKLRVFVVSDGRGVDVVLFHETREADVSRAGATGAAHVLSSRARQRFLYYDPLSLG